MLERDMQMCIHAWLKRTPETKVIYEFRMVGYCDMVGVLFARRVGRQIPQVIKTTAVELKLTDIAGVLVQATANRHCVHESFAAMPMSRVNRMRSQTLLLFRDAGIGLLAVDVQSSLVFVAVSPGIALPSMDPESFRRRWWARIVSDKRLGRNQ